MGHVGEDTCHQFIDGSLQGVIKRKKWRASHKIGKQRSAKDVRFHNAIKLLKGSNIDSQTSELLVDTLCNG